VSLAVAVPVPVGSVRIVAVGMQSHLTRGSAAEYRQRGLCLVSRPTAAAALSEIGKEPGSVVLVPSDIQDFPLLEFVDVVSTLAHTPLILGIAPAADRALIGAALQRGAETTVSLPVTALRLAAAVRAVAPAEGESPETLTCGGLTLDGGRYQVLWQGRDVHLPPQQFEILRHLMRSQPGVVTTPELVAAFADRHSFDSATRVRVAIGRIRSRLALVAPGAPSPIETVHKIGYRVRAD
jgi:DNA-binding response OmpR family regulator